MVTSAEITSTTHDAFLPNVWSKLTQDAVEFKEVLTKLVDTRHEAAIKAGGQTVEIPHYANLTTQSKTRAGGISDTVVYEAFTLGKQTVEIVTQEYAAFLLNEVVKAQSVYDDLKALTAKAGYALMRGMEVTIAALPQNFSQYVGTYGADIDDSILRRAHQYVTDAGFAEDCAWVFSPGAQSSIFGNDKFTSRDYMSEKSAIETAKLPVILGYPTYVSNLLRSPATGQHDCMLIHRSSIILVRQVQPTAKTEYKLDNLADGVVIFDLYDAEEAEQPAETPGSLSSGDSGAVRIQAA